MATYSSSLENAYKLTTYMEQNGTTEILIFKVTPQLQGAAQKTLVNIFSYEAEHFETQAIHIKRLFQTCK